MQKGRAIPRLLAVYAHVAQYAGGQLTGNPLADTKDFAKHLVETSVKALGCDMRQGSDDRTCVMPLEQNT